MAEKIFGKDIASIMGKITHQKPTPVVTEIVKNPPELMEAQREVDLSIITVLINEMPFYGTISKQIKYHTIKWLPSKTMESYRSVMKNIF